MKRRGFLSTLLLPFLPTPDLPWEQPFLTRPIQGFRVPFIPLKVTKLYAVVREEHVFGVINLRAVRKLKLYTKDVPMVSDEPAVFNGPWPKVEQF
jgi:hypothetical protein